MQYGHSVPYQQDSQLFLTGEFLPREDANEPTWVLPQYLIGKYLFDTSPVSIVQARTHDSHASHYPYS